MFIMELHSVKSYLCTCEEFLPLRICKPTILVQFKQKLFSKQSLWESVSCLYSVVTSIFAKMLGKEFPELKQTSDLLV